ncbi:DMT family transporter [Ectobacillus ponti]|uniref:DMT family transporter n=1 Tax=Ectobacillus ponti TaxID=2961894 RepID=A0AA42BNB1_9BACI|nr:DMT family transporter [Ectobacillus ponti]MCP8967795.1 DMT family transporter [Ectobacillus ponti]
MEGLLPMPERLHASLYALISITFWGISFVSTKALLDVMSPFTVLVMRFGIGSLFLCLLIPVLRGSLSIRLTYVPHLFILGTLGVFVHQILQATALLTINASSAGWIITLSPLFTLLLSMLFLAERMTLPKAIGILSAILGVLLIVSAGSGRSLNFSWDAGYFLMILSTLNWAVYSLLLKNLEIPLPPLTITFYTSLFGFLLSLPLLWKARGWEQLAALDGAHWAHLFFLGVFVSAVAYLYWAKAHEHMEASQVSMFMYLEPLATVVAAMLLLKEQILLATICGGLLTISGVLLANRRPH